jgi:hypothetical protein
MNCLSAPQEQSAELDAPSGPWTTSCRYRQIALSWTDDVAVLAIGMIAEWLIGGAQAHA